MSERFTVEAIDLTVGYGKKEIVKSLGISVSPGEIITLIGPNGSGKSTILKSIAAQLDPLGGTVIISGKNQKDMNEKEISKIMSVLLTGKAAPELITCGEVVESGRYPYTGHFGFLREHDIEVSENAMKLTGILHLKDTDFSKISDGQRQLVMLARAVCQEPRIMILDEPTSFLDIAHKLELLTILEKLSREKNISVIMSLHEVELAQKISDRIICIKENRADRTGTPDEIFSGNYISRLYGIENGTYSDAFGSAEMPAPSGKPEVFVIGSGEKVIPVYRRLRRMNIPFAAGIIHTNDVCFPAACSLASEVVSEKAFEQISDRTVENALEILKKCSSYINCVHETGTMNSKISILTDYAETSLTAFGKHSSDGII